MEKTKQKKKLTKKMQKKIIRSILIISIVIIILIILKAILFKQKDDSKLEIYGTWTTDGVTTYKFNKNKTGALILPLNKYEFTYKIKDDNLEIDFKSKKAKDAKYKYYFEKKQLVLEGENGKFIFIRKKDEEKKDK